MRKRDGAQKRLSLFSYKIPSETGAEFDIVNYCGLFYN